MRTSGVLMPISSLPSQYGIGTMGKEARRFVDFLEKGGQTYWQILPICPTSYGDSPYQSFSSFAGNPYFIDLELLCKDKLLTKKECESYKWGKKPQYVDYGIMYVNRYALLRKAYERFSKKTPADYEAFCSKEAEWLDEYTLFMALKDANGGVAWSEWDDALKFRKPEAMEEADFLNKFPEIIKDSDVVTISGSAPKGMGKDIYQKLIKVIKDQGKQVILDTSGEYLEKGLESQPTMVKPNEDEIELLFHTKIQSKDEVITYAKRIYKEKEIPYVVISLGGDGALLVCEKGIYQGKPPKIEIANTVGCGDSMVGAFAVALEKKMEPEAALKYAVSVASANALSPHTGRFDPKDRDEIIKNVEIIKLA